MIAAGHSFDAVGRYTFDQVELFLKAAAKVEKANARTAMIVARAAQADQKGFKRMLRGFD